jgi:hypothetical protein
MTHGIKRSCFQDLSHRWRDTSSVADSETSFTVTFDFYETKVNSVRYRERGHRDDWLIGDLYVKNQALPEPAPTRIEVQVSYA